MELGQTKGDILAYLKTTELFLGLPEPILEEIAAVIKPVNFEAGQVVMQKDDLADCLYLIREGSFHVISQNQHGENVLLNTIACGKSAGEIALLTGEKRTATVIAGEAAQTYQLSKQDFDQFKNQNIQVFDQVTKAIVKRLQQAYLGAVLHTLNILEQLDEPVRRDLEQELELILVPGGDVLVRQDEESDAIFIIINGRLKVSKHDPSGVEFELSEMGRGQTIGEIGLITGGKRTATAVALRDSLLARLSQQSFDRLLQKYPQAMMRQFAGNLINHLVNVELGRSKNLDRNFTFALLPINPDVPIREFSERLSNAFDSVGSTLLLNAEKVDSALGIPGIAHTPIDKPESITIAHWLGGQEANCQYLLYEAEPTLTPWTLRCLRQADRILLVANATSPAEISQIEHQIDELMSGRVAPGRILVLLQPAEIKMPANTNRWLEHRQLMNHYHVRLESTSDLPRLARLIAGKGVGFVMSGGGALGIAHLGALRALRERNIPVDLVGGTSAGGIMSCFVAADWDFETCMSVIGEAVGRKLKDFTFPITSFMAGAKMTENAKDFFGAATNLEDLWLPCFMVATNISSHRLIVHQRGPVWKYIRATSSVPGVFPPVMENGEMLVDGGLLNNMPVDIMQARPDTGTVFALDVGAFSEPPLKNVAYESSLNGWQVLLNRINPFAPKHVVPSIGQILMEVALVSSAQSIDETRKLANFYIPLAPGKYQLFDFEAFAEIGENGYNSTMEWLEENEQNALFQKLASR